MVNMLQLITLLVLAEAHLPIDVYSLIEGFSVFLFNFKLFDIQYPVCDTYLLKLYLCKYMELIGYESRSGVGKFFQDITVL